MGTFFDSFLPNIAQSAAQAPVGMLQGQVEGQQLAADLNNKEAHTAFINAQTQAMGQGNAKMQSLRMIQEGLAKDPHFLTTPIGQLYATQFSGHQVGQQQPIVGAPGSQILMPDGTVKQVPYGPHGWAPGSLVALPENSGLQTQMVPSAARSVSPGAQLVNPNIIDPETGQASVLAAPKQLPKAGGGPESVMSPEVLRFNAQQYLAGDKSVFQGVGRGIQGPANLVKLRETIMQEAKKAGMSPQQTALAMAEFTGEAAAQRGLGTRAVNFGIAQAEALKMADLVTQTSALFPRSSIPLANKAIQAFETGTGDVNTVRYGAALNSFMNAYARAISPTGQPTVSDKDHARDILSKAQSHEQVVGVIDLMKAEMEAAGQAPRTIKQERRDQFGKAGLPSSPMLKQSPLAQQRQGAGAVTPGAVPRISTDAQRDGLAPGTIYMAPDGKMRKKQ